MSQLSTTALFTDGPLDGEGLTSIVARSVLEAALAEDDGAELWFDIGRDDAETALLTIDLSSTDIEEILGLSGEDDVALTLDGEYVAALFDDADVEAHVLRDAVTVAVASAATYVPDPPRGGGLSVLRSGVTR